MNLSHQDIESKCFLRSRNDLIYPFDNRNLRKSSYDLTIGHEYYLGTDNLNNPPITSSLLSRSTLTIPPNGLCFLICQEKIKLPNDLTAKVSLRMKNIYLGLILSSQPPFDPGYDGKVIILLYNLSSKPIDLKQGERIVSIEFTRLNSSSTLTAAQSQVQGLQQQLNTSIKSSLNEIREIATTALDDSKDLSSKVMTLITVIVGVLAIIIAVPTLINFTSTSTADKLDDQQLKIALLEKISEQKAEELKELKKEVNDLKMALNKSENTLISHRDK